MQTKWRILAPGQSNRALLVVDSGPGRIEADFTDLAANLVTDAAMWQPVFLPPTDHPIDGTNPVSLVDQWLDDVRSAGLQVSGVLGYCAGAALAARTAELLRASGQGDPAIVLLDPGQIDGPVIRELVLASVERYAQLLPPELIEPATAAVTRICEALGTDLAGLPARTLADAMRELQQVYDDLLRDACDAVGANEGVAAGFSRQFAAFLGYLVTSGRVGAYSAESADATVIVSRDHQVPDGLPVAVHRLPVSRVDLLADPTLARLVAEALISEPGK